MFSYHNNHSETDQGLAERKLSVFWLVLAGLQITTGCGGGVPQITVPSAVVRAEQAPQAVVLESPQSATSQPASGGARFAWMDTQYRAVLTIQNDSPNVITGVLVTFRTSYAPGHPHFLYSQYLYLASLVDMVIPPGESRRAEAETPDGCDVLWQADFYAGVTADDIRSGRVNVNPAAAPKVHESTFHFGKSRATCAKPVPVPPPAPLPPVPPSPVPPPPQQPTYCDAVGCTPTPNRVP